MSMLQIIIFFIFVMRCMVAGESGTICEILYFPMFILAAFKIWKQHEKRFAFIWKKCVLFGIISVLTSYILMLATRQNTEYGFLYLFNLAVGNLENVYPDILWMIPVLLECLILYYVLEHAIKNTKVRVCIAGIGAIGAVCWMFLTEQMMPFYQNMVLLGVAIMIASEVFENVVSHYFDMGDAQRLCLGAALLVASYQLGELNARMMGETVEIASCIIGNPIIYMAMLLIAVFAFDFMDVNDQKEWRLSFLFYLIMGTGFIQMLPAQAGLLLLLAICIVELIHRKYWETEEERPDRLIGLCNWCGLFLISLGLGLQRIWLSDYNPINGDFQNYNVWRRLLDGQIPQKDFAAYLGMGHLYLGGLLTYLAGGSLTDSMFVSNLVTSLCCIIFLYMILALIIRSRLYALVVTSLVSLSVVLHAEWIQKLYAEMVYPLNCIANRYSDSMRMFRAFIVVIMVFASKKMMEHWDGYSHKAKRIRIACLSFLSGAAITYANDVGVSSYFSFSLLFFIMLLLYYRTDWCSICLETLRYIGWSIAGFFVALTLFSRGHCISYLKEMLGTASYQKWYYGLEIYGKLVNIKELYFDKYAVIGIVIVLYNIFRMIQNRKQGLKSIFCYAAVAYMILTAYVNATFYLIQSGRSNHALFYLLVFAAIVGYMIVGLLHLVPKLRSLQVRRVCAIIMAGVVLCTMLPITNENMARLLGYREGTFFPGLDGYLLERGQDLTDAIAYVGTDDVFSTYASALEVETNRFQPTGRDYIIHVLGDEQQKEYLEKFKAGNYKKVQTIDQNYDFGLWMMNANWYFYKEVFRNYQKTFRTSYSQFWEKASEPQVIEGCTIQTSEERFSDYVDRIHFLADCDIDALVDVSIDYESVKTKSFLETGNINLYTQVRDEFLQQEFTDRGDVAYFIPNKMENRHIPVLLRHGYGSVVFSSFPLEDSKIVIKNVTIHEVIKNPLEFPSDMIPAE